MLPFHRTYKTWLPDSNDPSVVIDLSWASIWQTNTQTSRTQAHTHTNTCTAHNAILSSLILLCCLCWGTDCGILFIIFSSLMSYECFVVFILWCVVLCSIKQNIRRKKRRSRKTALRNWINTVSARYSDQIHRPRQYAQIWVYQRTPSFI